jgi:hypothetical protein
VARRSQGTFAALERAGEDPALSSLLLCVPPDRRLVKLRSGTPTYSSQTSGNRLHDNCESIIQMCRSRFLPLNAHLVPVEDSNSITQSAIVVGWSAISSTNAGLAAFFRAPELRRAASSAPYSPAAADERSNTHRVVGPVPQQPATTSRAALSDAAAYCETHPTAVATP